MSNQIAIKVENLSKAYQLGQIGTGTISRDLERWYARMRGKEDPFLRIGESNNQNTRSESDVVWSLKDINFEIEQGDAVGIIGRNGAGKSTLLKILSKVTAPTTGKISGKGRIASLLEVGTGFHPELSGRENIFLNGAILGMRKKEIQRKLDEIVDFAGIERYLDTPVKRYSSGMYVRLAFAVAAHLESEILIVDEVLAVGDAEFQKKCLGKMGEVSKGEGRTVLFVSHNMASVSTLCNNGMILKNGNIIDFGKIEIMLDSYSKLRTGSNGVSSDNSVPRPGQKLKILSTKILDKNNKVTGEVNSAERATIEIEFIVLTEGRGYDVSFELVHSNYGSIFSSSLKDIDPDNNDLHNYKIGNYRYQVPLPMDILRGGKYFVTVGASLPKIEILDLFKNETHFSIIDTTSPVAKTTEGRRGAILPILSWQRMK